MSFPNVDAYCLLDLGDNGEVAQQLLDDRALDLEASAGEIQITDIASSVPAYLTPFMGQWYQSYIDGLRRSALDEIDAEMQAVGSEDVPGHLLERKLDSIEQQKIINKREARKEHQALRANEYTRLNDIRSDFHSARARFRQKRLERGREPKMITWVYWFIIFVIGVFEAFINFEAFASLSFMTPVIALGSTMIVAFLLAASSHLHGKFAAEIQHRFGKQRSPGDRAEAWRILTMGTFGLTVVLAAVWYARANYLQDAILEAAVIGGTPPSWLATVGGSLLMNLGVWILGVIIAYLWHDGDPHFPDDARATRKYEKKYFKAQDRLEKEISEKLEQIDAQAEIDKRHATGLATSMDSVPAYQAARKQFQRLTNQDAKVKGLLRKYQMDLAARAKSSGLEVKRRDEFMVNEPVTISIAEYAAMQPVLRYT